MVWLNSPWWSGIAYGDLAALEPVAVEIVWQDLILFQADLKLLAISCLSLPYSGMTGMHLSPQNS